MIINRRNFFVLLGGVAATTCLGTLSKSALAQEKPKGPFKLTPLPYDYNALEPYIDAETMKFHHDKHYAAYIKKLNEAVSKYPELTSQTAEELLGNIDSLPEDVSTTIRNNGGGYVNHKMFWNIMSPDGGGEPTGEIAAAITETFGSFDAFKTQFNDAGTKQFGSGWAWLALDSNNQLKVFGLPNQDSPLMEGMIPIMGNDVWEHAYYLKYRNKRDEYLDNWWNVVNWEEINQNYQQGISG